MFWGVLGTLNFWVQGGAKNFGRVIWGGAKNFGRVIWGGRKILDFDFFLILRENKGTHIKSFA